VFIPRPVSDRDKLPFSNLTSWQRPTGNRGEQLTSQAGCRFEHVAQPNQPKLVPLRGCGSAPTHLISISCTLSTCASSLPKGTAQIILFLVSRKNAWLNFGLPLSYDVTICHGENQALDIGGASQPGQLSLGN
jgi:hypothetical protein